jgi:signal transduction histidine kinase
LKFRSTDLGGIIEIRVTDHGNGIPEQHSTGCSTLLPRGQGTRPASRAARVWAWRIVKHIAQIHGGGATVEKSPRHRTTFTLRLPSRRPATQG